MFPQRHYSSAQRLIAILVPDDSRGDGTPPLLRGEIRTGEDRSAASSR